MFRGRAALIARTARRVWAMDLDAASVRYARQTHPADNQEFIQGDATSPPIRLPAVDLVIALEVLEHVEDQGAPLFTAFWAACACCPNKMGD
ncbi:MAG: methyltransferase domain-containing protein [Acidobacteriota bacterium]